MIFPSRRKIKGRYSKIKNSKKDIWDKLGSVSNVIVTLILGILGLYINTTLSDAQSIRDGNLKKHQLKNEEIEIVSKFMPYLKGSEEEKKLALLSIQSLGKNDLARNLALSFPDSISIGLLEKMTFNSNFDELVKIYNSLFQLGKSDEIKIQLKVSESINRVMLSSKYRQKILYCSEFEFDLKFGTIRNHQSTIGKLLTNSMLNFENGPKSDLAIIQSGAIRPNRVMNKCIKYIDVFEILPYDEKIISTSILGRDLIKIFIGNDERKGYTNYLQFSNVKYNQEKQKWFMNDRQLINEMPYKVLISEFLVKTDTLISNNLFRQVDFNSSHKSIRTAFLSFLHLSTYNEKMKKD